MARPPDHLRAMAGLGPYADAGRTDLRLHELLPQHAKQAASECPGRRVYAHRKWRQSHLRGSGARSGRRGALDRQQSGGWVRETTARSRGSAIKGSIAARPRWRKNPSGENSATRHHSVLSVTAIMCFATAAWYE